MAKIKYTKSELKTQRDALAGFRRYLPTLQLKKQQLQLELRRLRQEIEDRKAEEQRDRSSLSGWVRIFSDPFDIEGLVKVAAIRTSIVNIVGVNVPVLESVDFENRIPDFFLSPLWVDEAVRVLERLIRLRLEIKVIGEQLSRLEEELRTTTQRVNLFEKVKIPQCREKIRVIRIFLGDLMSAGVARAKIAKSKSASQAGAA